MYILISALICLAAIAGLMLWASRRWSRLAALEPRVLLTGGGTGGHVNPALAIAEGIKKKQPETRFLYVGVRGKAECVIVCRAGYQLRFVSSEGFPGLKLSLRSIRFLLRLSIGVLESVVILFRFAPRWVIATGGYVSAPIILATLLLRVFRLAPTKVFLHEQNSTPGQLNALLGRWVDRVLLTFPQTLSFFPANGVVVGYPIRHSILRKPREEALANLPFHIPEGRQVIFAFGGSQGSRTINRAIVDSLRHLLHHRDRVFIIHGMGLCKSKEYDAVADTEARLESVLSPDEMALLDDFYYRQDYFHNIADVYAVSDLVVCRSGAGSLNEICRLGKASILIPKANLPGDHQVMNARAMKHAEAAEVLFEGTCVENGEVLEKIDGQVLTKQILNLLQDHDRMHVMADRARGFLRRHANERILSELYEDNSFNNGVGYDAVPYKPLLTNQRLLAVLSAAYQRNGRAYDPLDVIGDVDDLSYYRHRASGLLSQYAWQERNLGVKLIGLTHYHEKVPTILHMLADHTPETWIKRLFGGDYRQVGFIRRNIVQALKVLNCFDSDVERHLLLAMDDPYFEVRSQACLTAAHFGAHLAGKEVWIRTLLKRLDDPSFEVVVAAVTALGEVGIDSCAVDILLRLREHHYWQVRDAALKGLRRLLERKVISPSPDLLSQARCFILTATDFRPHFSIKEAYRIIQKSCSEESAARSDDPEVAGERVVRKQ